MKYQITVTFKSGRYNNIHIRTVEAESYHQAIDIIAHEYLHYKNITIK